MNKSLRIFNELGNFLDVIVEGKLNADTTILFVHGFGANKHETGNYFDDVAAGLGKQYRIVRFDFSGYGKSNGNQEDVTLLRQIGDLRVMVGFVKKYFPGKLFVFAHSMGSFVTSLLCPICVERAIFTGIPDPNLYAHRDNLKRAILSRPGGILDMKGVSIYPRTSGEIQKIGRKYWEDLNQLQPHLMRMINKFALKTNLTIIHSLQDEIVGNGGLEEYRRKKSVKYLELPGNHNFAKPEDRLQLIETVESIFGN